MTNIELVKEAFEKFEINTKEIRNRFYFKRPLTDFEIKNENIDKNIAKKYTMEAISDFPPEPVELFIFFKECFASFILEHEKLEFVKKYLVWNEKTINRELGVINNWIANAKKISSDSIFPSINSNINFNDELHEYNRLELNYYENYLMQKETHLHETSISSKVYGRYFLFKNYLEQFVFFEPEIAIAKKYLSFMSGNNPLNHIRIMSDEDYKIIIDATNHYIQNKEIPTWLNKPISVNMNKEVVAFAYKFLYKKYIRINKRWNFEFFEFMGLLFADFESDKTNQSNFMESTLYKNYSKYEKKYEIYLGECKELYRTK